MTTTVPLTVRKSGGICFAPAATTRFSDPQRLSLRDNQPDYVPSEPADPFGKDAEYFIAWIDRLESGAERNTDWNSEWEKSQVLESIRQAPTEFERRRKD